MQIKFQTTLVIVGLHAPPPPTKLNGARSKKTQTLKILIWLLMFSLEINSGISKLFPFLFELPSTLSSFRLAFVCVCVCVCVFRIIHTSNKEETSNFNGDIWWRQPRCLPLEHTYYTKISIRNFLIFSDIERPVSQVLLRHSKCELTDRNFTHIF